MLLRAGANVRLLTKLGYAVRDHKQTLCLWPLESPGHQKDDC